MAIRVEVIAEKSVEVYDGNRRHFREFSSLADAIEYIKGLADRDIADIIADREVADGKPVRPANSAA